MLILVLIGFWGTCLPTMPGKEGDWSTPAWMTTFYPLLQASHGWDYAMMEWDRKLYMPCPITQAEGNLLLPNSVAVVELIWFSSQPKLGEPCTATCLGSDGVNAMEGFPPTLFRKEACHGRGRHWGSGRSGQ